MGIAVRLRWTVEDLVTVMASYDQIKVKRSTVGIGGPYTEITTETTRITLQAGKILYEHVDADGVASYWYRVTWYDSGGVNLDSDQDPFQGEAASGMLCQVEDLRAEGVTVAMMSDARTIEKILLWSRQIERWTRQIFEPRTKTIPLRSTQSGFLYTGYPPIRVDSIAYWDGRGVNFDDSDTIEVDDVLVFNRHLTAGLEDPDDRRDPRIELPGFESYFSRTKQGLAVTGIFGYTELDPDDSVGETLPGSQIPLCYGRTPALIKRACMLLVIRDLPQLADIEGREDYSGRWMLTSEKTADQSYTRASPASVGMVGFFSGDAQIDGIISQFLGGRRVGSV